MVLDGRTQEHWPQRFVASTATGTHRVSAEVEGGPRPFLPIIDAGGREIGRVLTGRRMDWVLQLVTGEVATVTGRGNMLTSFTCTVGDLSSAAAPRFAPQRYITLTLADAVLARPDRDALVVALAWLSESTIAGLITNANM